MDSYKRLFIIPEPEKITFLEGISSFKNGLFLSEESFNYHFFHRFSQLLQIPVTVNHLLANIRFKSAPYFPFEAYQLTICNSFIEIIASSESGFFYACQTLFQILFFSENNSIPNCVIYDKPRFEWRGIHLDESRHFFGKEFVKKMLDFCSLYKINRFHWHLTDDNGWRIEMKSYPKLHETGSKRINREHLPWKERDFPVEEHEKSLYEGYYLQSELQEIIEYAKLRNIEILPEIEMPGHCRAALAAYPECSCTKEARSVASGINKLYRDVFCAGNPSTYRFLFDILDETCSLFPFNYIHLGGDEVNPYHWLRCPSCQKLMKTENLNHWQELQHFFMKKVTEKVKNAGKIPILWDEILDSGELSDTVFMIWRGNGAKGLLSALQKKNKVIMCPNDTLYFDWKQEDSPDAKGAFGVTPLSKIYSYNPTSSPEDERLILGLQGNIWTEFMQDSQRVEYMTVPRICALAEIAWTIPENKNLTSFFHKVEFHTSLFQKFGMNFFADSY
jgi:hexosaminidase